jgi:anti-anti-sigma factor
MPAARRFTETTDRFPSQGNHAARFVAHCGPSATVVAAHGELDASNATQLADYVQCCTAQADHLILDLSGLKFFGTAGFSALHTINVRCAGADVRWAVVPSPAVVRLLRICDPDSALPVAEAPEPALTGDQELHRLGVDHRAAVQSNEQEEDQQAC